MANNVLQSISMGQATLENGEETVTGLYITAGSKVFPIRRDTNGSSLLGELVVTTITPGVGDGSFVLQSRKTATPADVETGDDSIFDYVVVG